MANELNKKKYDQLLTFMIVAVGLFVLYFGLHMAVVHSLDSTLNIYTMFSSAAEHMKTHPFSVIPASAGSLLYTLIVMVVYGFILFFLYNNSIIYAHTPYSGGSSDWNKDWKAYNKKYTDPKDSPTNEGEYNMILTQNISLSMNSRQTRRNNNILVVGGSGAGKSRFLVKPNLLQANSNFVITDPAGELLESTGKFLEQQGYEIKVFNLVEMAKSDRYNPFAYIRDDVGVLMMINCLIKNTNPVGQNGGDPFWEKSETALLQALVFYLIKYRPKHQQNFTSVMKLLRAAEVDENDSTKKSKLDRLFDDVALKDPNSIAYKQYLTFKMGAGKTLKSILISTSVRLTVFNMKQIENLTKEDTLELGKMGEGKKALFVIIPAADSTYNFLVSMMYSQLFETLYFVAETTGKGKRLDRPVRFLLDEFANIGQIPEFTKKLATMRKYEISCTIILQNLAQIKTMYEKDWESIVGNCDSFLFLGGQEYSTLEYISKELGTKTIKVRSAGRSHGKSGSSNTNTSEQKRELMTPDEIMRMPEDECILIVRGLKPFYDKKFEYTKHKNYKYTGDADENLLYVNTRNNSEDVLSYEDAKSTYQKHRAATYTKLLEARGDDETPILYEPMSVSSFINSLNIEDIDEIKSKIIVIGPDDLQQVKPNQKELVEQSVREAKRKEKFRNPMPVAETYQNGDNTPVVQNTPQPSSKNKYSDDFSDDDMMKFFEEDF